MRKIINKLLLSLDEDIPVQIGKDNNYRSYIKFIKYYVERKVG